MKMTRESAVLLTRKHVIENCLACIEEAERGDFFVNDLPAYVAWQKESIREAEQGLCDHTFAFRQLVHYYMTGETVGLLS